MHMGGDSDLCQPQKCFLSRPRQLDALLTPWDFKRKGRQLLHALGRVDLWASPPREETAEHILQLSHFSHSLHLI